MSAAAESVAEEVAADLAPNIWLLVHGLRQADEKMARLRIRVVTAAEWIEGRMGEVAAEAPHDLVQRGLAETRRLIKGYKGEGPLLIRLPGLMSESVDVHLARVAFEDLQEQLRPYRVALGMKP